MAQPIIHSLLSADIGGYKPMADYPGDNCCYLYDHYNYQIHDREPHTDLNNGRKKICHEGSRKEINVRSELGWGDRVSSYICGKNVWFDFCKDGPGRNCAGGDRSVRGAGYMRNYAIRHLNNSLDLAVLGPYDARDIGAVTLFEDYDCSGASGRLYWDPEGPASGTMYNVEDLHYGGVRNNNMQSLLVPKGYTVELYEHDGFTGRKQVVVGEYLNATEEMRCVKAD